MRNIVLDVPFIYTATVVLPRKRNTSSQVLRASVPVTIEFADELEMPVAFRITAPHGGDVTEVRWDGANCLTVTEPDEVVEESSLQGLLHGMRGTPFSHAQYSLGSARYRANEDAIPEREFNGKIISDNKEETISNIHDAAASFIFCAGKFWRKSGEPVWVVDVKRTGFGYGKMYASLDFLYICADIVEAAWLRPIFAAGDYLEARQCALTLGAADFFDSATVEILVPEAINVSGAAINLLSCAKYAIYSGSDDLFNRPSDYIFAAVRLRDAMASQPPSVVDDKTLSAIRDYLNCMTDQEGSSIQTEHQVMLQSALTRWEQDQPMSHSLPAP